MAKNKHIMYPFRRISFSKVNQVIEKAKDHYGFYCEECFNPVILNGNITINLSSIQKDSECEVDFFGAFVFECPKCHHKNIWTDWPLDPNIAPMIAELNSKGYTTVSSCEGHEWNRLEQTYPYIEFMYPGQKKVLRYIPLQGPWKLDTSIEGEDRFRIYCVDKSIGLRERMAHLRFWVNALPKCFSEEFTSDLLPSDLKERLERLNGILPQEDTGEVEFDKYLKMDPLSDMDDYSVTKLPENVRHNLASQRVPRVILNKDTRYQYAQLIRERRRKIKDLMDNMNDKDFTLDDLPDDVIIPIKIPNPFDGVEAARARAWAAKQEELEEWRKTRRLGKEKFKDHQEEVRERLNRRAIGLPEEVKEVKSTKGDPSLPYNGKKNSPRVYVPKEIRDAIPHNPPKRHKKDKPKGPRNYTRIHKSNR